MNSLVLHALFFSSLSWNLLLHPVHYSVTNIDMSAKSDSIQMVVQVNSSDLSLVISNIHEKGINLNDIQNPENKNYIFTYINSRIECIAMDNSKLNFSLNRYYVENEDLKIYLTALQPTKSEYLNIRNILLFDLFTDQTNLIIFSNSKFEKGYQTTYTNPKVKIKLTSGND